MIGFGVNFSGSYSFGGAGLTGLAGGTSSIASSRLIAGSALTSLDSSRASVAQIQAALTQLRDALQSARDGADAVPGRTTLQAITTDITHYVDKPTYVTVNGKPVQNGTITVADGTQEVVTGYERVTRGRTDIGKALKVLLNATVNVGSAPGLASVNTFGSQIGAFLKSVNLNTAVTNPDKAALDGALQEVNGLLASATGLGFTVNHNAAAAAQVDLSGLLLGASAGVFDSSTTTTNSTGVSAYQTTSTSTSSTSSGSTVSTVA